MAAHSIRHREDRRPGHEAVFVVPAPITGVRVEPPRKLHRPACSRHVDNVTGRVLPDHRHARVPPGPGSEGSGWRTDWISITFPSPISMRAPEIGRASCRESGGMTM